MTAVILGGGRAARIAGPAAVLAGVAVELAVLRDNGVGGSLAGALAAAGVGAAVLLAAGVLAPRARKLAAIAAIAALLAAPAAWSAQTLGHAASGTFPAGGPATTGFGGRRRRRPVRRRQPDPLRRGRLRRANGGGTIAVSSQSGAAGQLIASGADVAAIGGFSGRESEVSVAWLADAVEQGRIRYVLTAELPGCRTTAAPARAR